MKNIIIFSSGVLLLFLASLNYAAAPQVPEETAIQIFKSAKFQKTNQWNGQKFQRNHFEYRNQACSVGVCKNWSLSYFLILTQSFIGLFLDSN